MTQIFIVVELILKIIGLWDGLLNYIDAKRLADDEAKRQRRDGAVDDATKAATPDDAFKAQTGIVDNEP